MLTDKLKLVIIAAIVIGLVGIAIYPPATVVQAAGTATTILIKAQNYTDNVSAITFPQAAPGATVSLPYNNVNGSGSAQSFGDAGVARPVVTLVNTDTVPYTIWYTIATFANGVVTNEYYLINDKGAALASADNITNAVTFDANTTTGKTIAASSAGDAAKKDLYLKVVLSAVVAGKTGTSTLTILGEP